MNKQREKTEQGIERRAEKNRMEDREQKEHRKEQKEQMTNFEILD